MIIRAYPKKSFHYILLSGKKIKVHKVEIDVIVTRFFWGKKETKNEALLIPKFTSISCMWCTSLRMLCWLYL